MSRDFKSLSFCLQENITYIKNSEVRDMLLNKTLTVLSPKFQNFTAKDYELYFQVYLKPLMPSFNREQLELIPANINCESYAVM